MALDFTALQAEVAARGFDYLTTAGGGSAADLVRLKRAINFAMHDVDSVEKWDYTYATSNGAMPLTIADLRLVEDPVTMTVSLLPLIGQDRALLESVYGFLGTNTSGTPRYWFRSAPTVVTAYPLNTALSITVRYWKFAPDLSSGADVPLMPDRFREVIVEKACAYLFRDSNDVNAANDCLAAADRIIADMRAELLPDYVVKPAVPA